MEPHIWAEIKRLHQVEQCSISEISRRVRMDRKTVRKALQAEQLPVRQMRQNLPSKLDAYKSYILDRLKTYPQLPATVLYEEITRNGYTGKLRILWQYVASIRQKKREAFLRIETLPGEYAQVDWAHCGTVQIGSAARVLSCFVMVLSYSRMLYLEFRLSQCLQDFIQCHINAFQFFGGVSKSILYDNVKTVVLSRLGSTIQMNPQFMAFAGVFLFRPVCCNPGRGNEKGKVESGIKYIRSSFLAGRSVAWPNIIPDAVLWRDETANVRQHATTRERPLDRFALDQQQLLPLPDKEYDASIPQPVIASSQALVRFDGNRYSVPSAWAYATLTLKTTLQDVCVYAGRNRIARHNRSYERGMVIENPAHYAELIAQKKKAMTGKLKGEFLALGSIAHTYMDGLLKAELQLPHHIRTIMDYVRSYGKTEVLQAMDHAIAHHAYGAPYLRNIIFQQRAARGVKESVPISIPAKPAWTQVCVEEQDLALYDDICTDDTAGDDANRKDTHA